MTTPEKDAPEEKLDSFMSGEEALDIFTDKLKEKGISIPKDYIWKTVKRHQVEAAIHNTFGLIGGVPKFMLWAHENPSLFYSAYMKLAPNEQTVNATGNFIIQTGVPDSPLNKPAADATDDLDLTDD